MVLDRPLADHLMKRSKRKNPTTEVLAEIVQERFEQDEKWGVQNHSAERWMNILMEEVGEASKNVLEAYPHKDAIYSKENALRWWRKEMIQVAAVAVAAIECYDRNME